MVQLNFDASTVAPDAGIDALPSGWYDAMIDESEMKPAKTSNGMYLQIRFSVINGPMVNRKVFTRLNLKNDNETTVNIARSQLSGIAHAVGVIQVQDSSQLHGIPLKIRVKKRPATEQYEASNDVTAFRNINDVVESDGSAGATPQPAQMAAPGSWTPPAAQGAPQAPQMPPQMPPQAPAAPAAPVAPAPVAPAPVAPAPVAPAPVAPAPVAPAPVAPAPVAPAAPPVAATPAAPAPAAQPWDQPAQGQPAAPAAAPVAAPAPAPGHTPATASAQAAPPPWAS